jgi:hypothetical protein
VFALWLCEEVSGVWQRQGRRELTSSEIYLKLMAFRAIEVVNALGIASCDRKVLG